MNSVKVDSETLAKEIHESYREPLRKNLVIRKPDSPFKFIDWDDLEEDVKEGRRESARFLLSKFKMEANSISKTACYKTNIEAAEAVIHVIKMMNLNPEEADKFLEWAGHSYRNRWHGRFDP